MSIKIRPFEQKYARLFRELNLAWLEQYFYVEAKDKEILDNCQEYIIDQGGYIFFAEIEGEIVGCFSFIPFKKGIYELGKMAVHSSFQGRKIGQEMMRFAIEFARKQAWRKILLYSHRKLGPAIYIYRKYGFEEIPLEQNTPYERSNIKMELSLID